ncbi:MAG TPA: type II toxin-antitoxin system VapC family toxin [Vicinamibacterales bacterium]|nr:type II toxin-antitoxin system VapC family toxin [Vicinamibacterales bacterium]
MTVHLDTSALIDALTGPRRSLDALIRLTDEGHRLAISSIVLYEWQRGSRTTAELDAQEALLPSEASVPFAAAEAALAADLYRRVKRGRGREVDLAIAACAMSHGAALLTLNRDDFLDIAGLRVI